MYCAICTKNTVYPVLPHNQQKSWCMQLHISEDFLYLYHASLDDHAVWYIMLTLVWLVFPVTVSRLIVMVPGSLGRQYCNTSRRDMVLVFSTNLWTVCKWAPRRGRNFFRWRLVSWTTIPWMFRTVLTYPAILEIPWSVDTPSFYHKLASCHFNV
jgi:hypothetical protein